LAFSEEYFINVNGEQKGPYTFPQLKRLYETDLIPEETEYWQDGMEQWLAVADLCGARKRDRLRLLKQLRVAGIALLATVTLVLGYCGPVLKDGWREMNDRDQTMQGAYWRARGYVREDVKKTDESVAFESYGAATVALSGTAATVILPGTLYGRDGAGTKKMWKVEMDYDAGKREWVLPGG
jgi:uncharacterized protein DUF4339